MENEESLMFIYLYLYFYFSYDSRQTTASSEQMIPNVISNGNDGFDVYQTKARTSAPQPDLWSEPTAFGDRAHFRVATYPAELAVTGVRRFDAGTYTCRVDFRQSPTIYHHVKLDVIGKISQHFDLFFC